MPVITQQEPEADGLISLTLRRIVGHEKDGTTPKYAEDVYRVPPMHDLEADLTAELLEFSAEFWMARFLTRHAPDLAKKIRRSQLAALFAEYINDTEATPGESEASSDS